MLADRVMAIDPGTTHSAYVLCEGARLTAHGKVENDEVIKMLETTALDMVVIEMVASYGMPVGREVFETVLWIGRFIQANRWRHALVYRRDVKLHLCGSPRANDATIRQALIDRFGKPGTKREPGATYGLKADEWQAFALAVTWMDQNAAR